MATIAVTAALAGCWSEVRPITRRTDNFTGAVRTEGGFRFFSNEGGVFEVRFVHVDKSREVRSDQIIVNLSRRDFGHTLLADRQLKAGTPGPTLFLIVDGERVQFPTTSAGFSIRSDYGEEYIETGVVHTRVASGPPLATDYAYAVVNASDFAQWARAKSFRFRIGRFAFGLESAQLKLISDFARAIGVKVAPTKILPTAR